MDQTIIVEAASLLLYYELFMMEFKGPLNADC